MSSKAKNYLFIAIIFVGVTFFSLYRGGGTVTPSFGTDSVTISGGEEFHFTVDYDEIAALELVELDDLGEMVSGEETRTCCWGTWENEAWGRYSLCVIKKGNNAILITTEDQERFVFNFESEESTAEMHEAFLELLAAREADGE